MQAVRPTQFDLDAHGKLGQPIAFPSRAIISGVCCDRLQHCRWRVLGAEFAGKQAARFYAGIRMLNFAHNGLK